jgi:hypothetical protein
MEKLFGFSLMPEMESGKMKDSRYLKRRSNQHIAIVFIFKFFIPIGAVAFSLFYLLKLFVRKLKLDNYIVFHEMSESI